LISKIHDIQGSCMNGEKPVDVVLVRLGHSSANAHNVDVEHRLRMAISFAAS
jgi:hypothetical protein